MAISHLCPHQFNHGLLIYWKCWEYKDTSSHFPGALGVWKPHQYFPPSPVFEWRHPDWEQDSPLSCLVQWKGPAKLGPWTWHWIQPNLWLSVNPLLFQAPLLFTTLCEMGKQWKQCQTLFFWALKSLQMVTAAMKLKDAYSLEGKLWPT